MASPGYTDVSANQLRDASGTLITNATAVFTPNQSFRTGDPHGQTVIKPIIVPVLNGALSTVLADTSISNPANVSYRLVITDNLSGDVLLANGYSQLQPSGSSWSLDNYVTPISGPLVVKVAGQNLNFRGAWQPNTSYAAYDVFTNSGSSYIVTAPNTSGTTFDPTQYTMLASTGTPGILTGTYPGTVKPAAVAFGGSTIQGPPSSIDGKYLLAFLDSASRKVLAGFTRTGEAVGFPGIATSSQISQIKNVKILGPNSLNACLAVLDATGRRALWYVRRDGTVVNGEVRITVPVLYGTSSVSLPSAPARLPLSHAAFAAQLNHVLLDGQSLSTGADSKPVITTSQPFDNLMFNGTYGVNNGSTDARSALVPLREYGTGGANDASQQETCANGFADRIAWYVRRHRLTHTLLMSGIGRDGTPYRQPNDTDPTHSLAGPTDFSPTGSSSYQTGMQQIAAGKSLATGRYAHQAVLLIHGEADTYALNNTNYGTNLATWQQDIQTGSNAITGDTATIPFIYKQCTYALTGLQQLARSVSDPLRHVIACPDYIIPHQSAAAISAGANSLHLTNYGQRMMGEYLAKAYIRHVIHGWTWTPLAPVSINYGNRSIVLTYGGGDGSQLVLDTSVVTDPGNYGFSLGDSAGTKIVSVAVTGTQQITLTLDRHMAASGRTLSYATTGAYGTGNQGGPAYGPRGCVRNSCPELSYYPDASGNNYNLYDYSVAYSVTF